MNGKLPSVRSGDASFLSKSQVQDLWDAASFLVQEYGVLLNTRIVVFHELDAHPGVGAALVSELVHELGLALRRWAPRACERFHWLYVHQRGSKTGFSTVIVAHIPPDLAADARNWLFERFLSKRLSQTEALGRVRFRSLHFGGERSRVRRHFQLARLLCRSVDPDIKVRADTDRRALIDVLRIPICLREKFSDAGVPQGRRVSESLGEKVRRKAVEERMAPLSAFRDQAWHAIATGWELMEHSAREIERDERRQKGLEVDLEWPVGSGARTDQVRDAARKTLQLSWPIDPRERRRGWEGWWLSASNGPGSGGVLGVKEQVTTLFQGRSVARARRTVTDSAASPSARQQHDG
jgi:DNA polymerase III subunit gamma/tau